MISIFASNINSSLFYTILEIVGYFSALLVALSFHEFAHAFIAYKNGDPTAKVMGRLTLKPFSHFDAVGFISLVLFGFGWAKPVPVDYRNFKNPKKSGFLVAIAGVSLNLILGLLFIVIFALLICFCPQVFSINIYGYMLYSFLYYAIMLNFSLAFFNILPIFPLDGFRVVEVFAKPNNSYVITMRRFGQIFLIILILVGAVGLYIRYVPLNLADWLLNLFIKLFAG
ncbi:MAG: site-2 protease family protein [Clostridia bacterium]|nr:site-2 protease family protein [Clostridia bacterium]